MRWEGGLVCGGGLEVWEVWGESLVCVGGLS